MGAFGFGNSGGAAADSPIGPFTFPVGSWHVPLDSTADFGLRRATNAGQAIATVATPERRDFVSGKSGTVTANSIRFTTGTGYLEAGFGHVFQTDDDHPAGATADKADLTNYHMLLRVRITYGGANKATTFNFTMTDSRTGASWGSNYKKMSLATHAMIADSGVYTFSITPSGPGWVTNGTFDIAAVGAVTLSASCAAYATQQNVIEVLEWAFVPKPALSGVLVLHLDDVDLDNELCDWLDTNIPGAKATLYVRSTDAAGILAYQDVQDNGHLIAHYAETFGTPAGFHAQFNAQTEMREWLIANGFGRGSRHMVMGGTAMWGDEYERAWPRYYDTISFMDTGTNSQVHSPYHHAYMSRARHADDWATGGGAGDTEMTNLLAAAIADNGRMGVLVHDLTGTPDTNLKAWLTTNVAPAVTAGTLRVLTARDAYLEGF